MADTICNNTGGSSSVPNGMDAKPKRPAAAFSSKSRPGIDRRTAHSQSQPHSSTRPTSEDRPPFPVEKPKRSMRQVRIARLMTNLEQSREDSDKLQRAQERNEEAFTTTLLSEPPGTVQYTYTVTTLYDLREDVECSKIGPYFVVPDPGRPSGPGRGMNPARQFFVDTRLLGPDLDIARPDRSSFTSVLVDFACQAISAVLDWVFPAIEHPEMRRAEVVSDVALQLSRTRKRIEEGRAVMLATERMLEDMICAESQKSLTID